MKPCACLNASQEMTEPTPLSLVKAEVVAVGRSLRTTFIAGVSTEQRQETFSQTEAQVKLK